MTKLKSEFANPANPWLHANSPTFNATHGAPVSVGAGVERVHALAPSVVADRVLQANVVNTLRGSFAGSVQLWHDEPPAR